MKSYRTPIHPERLAHLCIPSSALQDVAVAVRATSVGAVHAASASSLLAGAAGERALEAHKSTADLVADSGMALGVVDLATAAKDVAAAGAGGSGVRGVRHFGGWLWRSLFGRVDCLVWKM